MHDNIWLYCFTTNHNLILKTYVNLLFIIIITVIMSIISIIKEIIKDNYSSKFNI